MSPDGKIAYMIANVPHGLSPGQAFAVSVNGQQMRLQVPAGHGPGQDFLFGVPAPASAAAHGQKLFQYSLGAGQQSAPAPQSAARAAWTDPQGHTYNTQPVQPHSMVPGHGMGAPYRAGMPYTADTPAGPAASCGRPLFRASGRRKAFSVGINYFGKSGELKGCINDVKCFQRILAETYGWSTHPSAMRCLTDDGGRGVYAQQTHAGAPTKRNIEQGLRWLVQGAQPGDCLFFHFSGHGSQKVDDHGYEKDGMNETILPSDYSSAGMIADDVMATLTCCALPDGVRLTVLFDACHSGTGLDLPFVLEGAASGGAGRWRQETNPLHTYGDVVLISGCEDSQTSADMRPRYKAPSGAMTSALAETLKRNPQMSCQELLAGMHRTLKRWKMSQRPQLSSSQRFDARRAFDPSATQHGVQSNQNRLIGRTSRKVFPPQPRPVSGPLASMLGAAGLLLEGMVGKTGATVITSIASGLLSSSDTRSGDDGFDTNGDGKTSGAEIAGNIIGMGLQSMLFS
jgi:hypothetical protein